MDKRLVSFGKLTIIVETYDTFRTYQAFSYDRELANCSVYNRGDACFFRVVETVNFSNTSKKHYNTFVKWLEAQENIKIAEISATRMACEVVFNDVI